MICQTIDIKVNYADAKAQHSTYQPTLRTYIIEPSLDIDFMLKRPAVVICPGGGFNFTSEREAEAVALKYTCAGYHAFVLKYSCSPALFPTALLELAEAIRIIRKNATEWRIQKNKIIINGFSAGGHLAASLGVFWNRKFLNDALSVPTKEYRPNGLILAYPVITSGEFCNRESINNLIGSFGDVEKESFLSLENQVTKAVPPSFIWHTQEDALVPVENSLLFASALQKNKVPFELHVYQKGPHGLSVADEQTAILPDHNSPHVQSWMQLAVDWIKNL